MRRPGLASPPSLAQYALAVLSTVTATVVLLILRDSLSTPIVALLYLLPVVFSTATWGFGPGVVAALCAFLSFNFLFIVPYYTFAVHQAHDVLALVVFLIVAVVISRLLGRARAGVTAATAREQETASLYELSMALAGLQDEQAIARTIAEHVLETFQAEHVELLIKGKVGHFRVSLPEPPAPLSDQPMCMTPLETARGRQGEIRLWRGEPPIAPVEERLLRTFASQGALALERARLAQAETRAKVLEESDRLKSALLSSVSHELRSPLAAIKAGITSLRSREVHWDSPAGADLLAVVEEEVDHLNRLVGNLLDMSRIESGALKPKRQWNVLVDIFGSALERMHRAAEAYRIEIDLRDDLPLVPVDAAQLEQVFTNLISNSLKYAPPGSVIYIGACPQDDQTLLVEMRNQGPPIDEEHLERIFDKFYRVTAADRVTGTGLGLSICKGIVEAHGGRIWAENRPDGLAFKFTLPLTWDGAQPPVLPPTVLSESESS
ncbi:MAG TPA: ATP-binding protein [Anaerolineae bacterium]|nr:ATP-binding protein [Anaerolineae bacterium]